MLRRVKFNVSIDVWSEMSSNRRKSRVSRRYKNFKYITRSDSRDDINEYIKKRNTVLIIVTNNIKILCAIRYFVVILYMLLI